MKGNDNKTMKILNNLNSTSIIRKIKYPFIKIGSLFQRVTVANRIQIVENPKYISRTDMQESPKSSPLRRIESFSSDTSIDEEISDYQHQYLYRENPTSDNKGTEGEEFQDLHTFNGRHPQKADPTHLYTRVNKTGNREIHRYLPSDERTRQKSTSLSQKGGQPHPFVKKRKEVKHSYPSVPPKNRALLREILQRDAFYLRFPRFSQELNLTILKGSELFI